MREDLKPKKEVPDELAEALWRVMLLGLWAQELAQRIEGWKLEGWKAK